MLGWRRRPLAAAVAVVGSVVLLAAGAVVVTRSDGPRSAAEVAVPGVPGVTGPPTTVLPPDDGTRPSTGTALVDVGVATVWIKPDLTRPVDAPSLGNPADVRRWVSTMTMADKLGLVDRLATQVLYGDRVKVLESSAGWTRVVVPGQPSSLDPNGYPGWVPTVQLRFTTARDTGRTAVVTAPTTMLRDPTDPSVRRMELSFETRLPVVSADSTWVAVATPGGGTGLLVAADVEVYAAAPRRPTGADLVASARSFSGLPYLWAGTSGAGFDCSGFTSAVYGAHGVTIPRDADDQAAAGVAVDRASLQPGDLLFYATDGGRGAIHHVSMYVGNGMMIQSPSTGRTVETVAVDTSAYAREFWGARRYLT